MHVNHKSHVFQPTIIMYQPKFWWLWDSFMHIIILKCMIHNQMHLCFIFSVNNYTFRFNGIFNKTFTSKKPPFSNYISNSFSIILSSWKQQICLEDFICNWNLLFAIENLGSQQVQVESDISIENVNHVWTPHQLPLQTILAMNDINCYTWKSFWT